MDENYRSIRECALSLCALALLPPEDVLDIFDELYNEVPDDFIPIADYLEMTYVRGRQLSGEEKQYQCNMALRLEPVLCCHSRYRTKKQLI